MPADARHISFIDIAAAYLSMKFASILSNRLWLLLAAPSLFLPTAGCTLIHSSKPDYRYFSDNQNFSWQTDTTSHFIIYYEELTAGEARLDAIREDAEQSFSHILTLLEESVYKAPLRIFIVDSRQKMKSLIGAETNGMALPESGVLCYLVSYDMMLSARHELLHIVAMNLWGHPEHWINEGLAVYADDHWHNHDLQALTTHLANTEQLLPLKKLTGNFKKHNDLVTYPQAGSLVKYLYQTYGVASIKALWQRGIKNIEEITGDDLEVIEAAWLAWAKQKSEPSIEYLTSTKQ